MAAAVGTVVLCRQEPQMLTGCISIHRGSLDIYIRFWEYSKGVGNYPDWSIIIARCEFRDELRENRFELFKDLVRFFKEYMPR